MMKVQRFIAATSREAMAMVRQALGPQAVIFSNQKHEQGVEIKAGIESEVETEDVVDMGSLFSEATPESQESHTNTTIKTMQNELEALRNMMREPGLMHVGRDIAAEDTRQVLLENRLVQLGFSRYFGAEIVKAVNFKQAFSAAWLEVQQGLVEACCCVPDLLSTRGTYAFIGPTGVGKSSAIIKLATRYVMNHSEKSIGIITTDVTRVASREQLKIYSNILGIRVTAVSDKTELTAALTSMQDYQLVLIDTGGVNPRDPSALMALNDLLNIPQLPIQKVLTLSAATQIRIANDIIEAFRDDTLAASVITKVDECEILNPILEVCLQQQLPLCYLSRGEGIPEDLSVINAKELIAEFTQIGNQNTLTSNAIKTTKDGVIENHES